MAQPLPTPLERFRENHRECRGVAAARQYSRTFSASGKSLNLWALILSPTLSPLASTRALSLSTCRCLPLRERGSERFAPYGENSIGHHYPAGRTLPSAP